MTARRHRRRTPLAGASGASVARASVVSVLIALAATGCRPMDPLQSPGVRLKYGNFGRYRSIDMSPPIPESSRSIVCPFELRGSGLRVTPMIFRD